MSNPHIIGVIRRQNPPSAIGIPLKEKNLRFYSEKTSWKVQTRTGGIRIKNNIDFTLRAPKASPFHKIIFSFIISEGKTFEDP